LDRIKVVKCHRCQTNIELYKFARLPYTCLRCFNDIKAETYFKDVLNEWFTHLDDHEAIRVKKNFIVKFS